MIIIMTFYLVCCKGCYKGCFCFLPVHPVNLFSLFHWLSPCRIRTKVCAGDEEDMAAAGVHDHTLREGDVRRWNFVHKHGKSLWRDEDDNNPKVMANTILSRTSNIIGTSSVHRAWYDTIWCYVSVMIRIELFVSLSIHLSIYTLYFEDHEC